MMIHIYSEGTGYNTERCKDKDYKDYCYHSAYVICSHCFHCVHVQ